MLVLQQHDGRVFCDREALAVWLKRPAETIRKRCPVVGYHADRRALYDFEVCEQILSQVPARKPPSA